MSAKARWITALLVGIPGLLIGFWLGWQGDGSAAHRADTAETTRASNPSPTATEPTQAKLVLVYTDGAFNGPGALILRLFSPAARKTGKHVEMSFPKGIWHRVQFQIETPSANSEPATPSEIHWKEARLRRFPTARRITLGPSTTLEAVYRIAPQAVPSAGSRIVATMELEDQEIRSSAITVGELPQKPEESRQRAAEVALRVEDFEDLLKAADAMIQASPASSDGYWFRGLALEGLNQPDQALQAYKRSLELRSDTSKLASGEELPTVLMGRIHYLEQRLSDTKG